MWSSSFFLMHRIHQVQFQQMNRQVKILAGWEESNTKPLKTQRFPHSGLSIPWKRWVKSITVFVFVMIVRSLITEQSIVRAHDVVEIMWNHTMLWLSCGSAHLLSQLWVLPALCPSLDGWGWCQQPEGKTKQAAQSPDHLLPVSTNTATNQLHTVRLHSSEMPARNFHQY